MEDLSYRSREIIETPQDVRARENAERRKQAEYERKQGLKRGLGSRPPKIDSVTHVFDDGSLRIERVREEQEVQSAFDRENGSKLNLRRIGWA